MCYKKEYCYYYNCFLHEGRISDFKEVTSDLAAFIYLGVDHLPNGNGLTDRQCSRDMYVHIVTELYRMGYVRK